MGRGRRVWGQQNPGGGRGTSKDAGRMKPRGGGSVWVGSRVLPDILLRVAKECMVTAKTRLVLSFITFSADSMPSLLHVPTPASPYPLTTQLVWLCLRNAFLSLRSWKLFKSRWFSALSFLMAAYPVFWGDRCWAGQRGGPGCWGSRGRRGAMHPSGSRAGLRCPDRGPACDRHSLPEPEAAFENQSEDTGLGDTLRDLTPGGKWRFGS